jgi:hypothetical protein
MDDPMGGGGRENRNARTARRLRATRRHAGESYAAHLANSASVTPPSSIERLV